MMDGDVYRQPRTPRQVSVEPCNNQLRTDIRSVLLLTHAL